jgi:hypothetical protein
MFVVIGVGKRFQVLLEAEGSTHIFGRAPAFASDAARIRFSRFW